MYQSKEGNHDRVVRYDIRGTVHPIQARKAWEDNDTWLAAVVVAHADGFIDVLFLAESEDADDVPIGRPVWVTERWGVLAYADENGNAIAIKKLADMPQSVFALAGAERLGFVSVRRVEDEQPDLDELVYGTVTDLGGDNCFFINRRVDAEYAAEIEEVVRSCSTWGEVREVASLELYDDLLSRCGYGTLDDYLQHLKIGRPIRGAFEMGAETFEELGHSGLPDDDEPFDADEISGYIDGDFPPAPDYLQDQLLPDDLADEYGHKMETIFNGTYLKLPPESQQPIVAAMEKLGYRCVEDPDLFIDGFRF
jgi:hypothetical protein